MTVQEKQELGQMIMAKAKEFGADLVGIANVSELKKSPSHTIFGKLKSYDGVGTKEDGAKKGEVLWPENAKSVIVFAIEHPEDKPELDWWEDGYSGGTRGNRELMRIAAKTVKWLESERGINCVKLPYHIEHGGLFLKDAAILGGIGILGKINILLTPQFGPRVRLRAITMDTELDSVGIMAWDPCEKCELFCRLACPQHAFDKKVFSAEEYGQRELPARDGVYARETCNLQMEKNLAEHVPIEVSGWEKPGKLVKYCRICELACPLGRA